MSGNMKGYYNRFSRRNYSNITKEVFSNRRGCGQSLFVDNGNSTPIDFTGGFVRSKRFTKELYVKDFIELGYSEEMKAIMFRFRQVVNHEKVEYDAYPADADIYDLRDKVNMSGGTWYTLYDDKMVTMSRGIYESRNNTVLMNAWATMIGVYFVRECEERFNKVEIIDIMHLWGISNFEDIFKFTFDLKTLGHAMKTISPHDVTKEEMKDILSGNIRHGVRWLNGIVGDNVTVREGAYEIKRKMLPGPVSFISDLQHQLVMWHCGDDTYERASKIVNMENYIICSHILGDNHSIMFKKMFMNVAFEEGDYIGRDFEDLSRIRVTRDFTICGIELAREVCCMFRKISFTDRSRPIGICEQVPMVTNYHSFEREVRQTAAGRMFCSIYSTFLMMGYVTEKQIKMIEKARKWGRSKRGSDDYGIYIMLMNEFTIFMGEWAANRDRLEEIHPIFTTIRW